MPSADDFQLAIAHYRLQFPTLGSLGDGGTAADWKAEYDRVSSEGLSATLITNLNYEGGGHSGIQNFDQKILIRALLARRAELDSSFDAIAFGAPAIAPRRQIGIRVWL
jgi:hypothetical protein